MVEVERDILDVRSAVRVQGILDDAVRLCAVAAEAQMQYDLYTAGADGGDGLYRRVRETSAAAAVALTSAALCLATTAAEGDCQDAHALVARQVRKALKRWMPDPRKPIDKDVRRMVFRRDNYQCVECFEAEPALLTIDHRLPVALGGGNEPDNLRTLCRRCNSSKGARL